MESKSFADLIRPYRTEALMVAFGVSKNTIGTWRRGEGLPASGSLSTIATYLKVDPAELLSIIETDSRRMKAVA